MFVEMEKAEGKNSIIWIVILECYHPRLVNPVTECFFTCRMCDKLTDFTFSSATLLEALCTSLSYFHGWILPLLW